MILIYKDDQILDLQWLNKLKFPGEYRFTESFDEYISTPADSKIAFTTHRLRCDPINAAAAYAGFEDLINQLSAVSNVVFSFESELHHYHWQIWEKCHHDNVYWVLTGQVNDRDDMNNNIIYWGDWFTTTAHVYKMLPHKLAEIQTYTTKPKMFDALLGSPKPHRDFVANAVKQHGLEDQFILTYGGQWKNDEFYAKDYFIWESDIEIVAPLLIGTADAIRYCGVFTGLSRVIPIKVFNETAYSIIAETDHDNTLSFFSEKTAKPIIARRLFVAFTGYKFLHNLRSFGFRTFDAVIDESYDLIMDDEQRYAAAFEQVKKLCSMDQQQVYDLIRPVTEHNYELMMSRDWVGYAAEGIQRAIDSAQL